MSNAATELPKFRIQDKAYGFPYHYIPHFDVDGTGVRHRILHWGYEYLVYMKHACEIVASLNPRSVLDVGCGDGRFLSLLNDQIPHAVGVDLSERAIRFAKAFQPETDFRCMDAADLEECFDVVVTIQVLEHIPDDQVTPFLKGLARCTHVGGHVLIMVPSKVIPLNPKHYRHYDISLLTEQLEASGLNLRIMRVEYLCRQGGLYRLIMRLNKRLWWLYEYSPIRRRIWRYFWGNLRTATETDGGHLCVLLEKTALSTPHS